MRSFFAALLLVATGLNPWQPDSLSAQTAEQKKHPKYPKLIQHVQAYQAAQKKGNHEARLREGEAALQLALEILGDFDPLTAMLYDILSVDWIAMGDYDKAINYAEKAAKIGTKTYGEEHQQVTSCYQHLGFAWEGKREYAKAIAYHEKVLRIRLRTLGEHHKDTLDSYTYLGFAWWGQREYDRAIEYHEKALSVGVKTLGEEHLDVASYYDNLGTAWRAKREYDKAVVYIEKALKIRLKILGDEHQDAAKSYSSLGFVFADKGEYRRAIEYHEKALKIGIKTLGEEHWTVTSYYDGLGKAQEFSGLHENAIASYEYAMKIKIKILGNAHPDVAYAHKNLGRSWEGKGNYDKAIEHHEHALKILRNGQDRQSYLTGLDQFAYLLEKAKKNSAASEVYAVLIRQILAYRLELSGEKTVFTARYSYYFSDAISFELSQKNHAKAFEYDSVRRGLSLAEALSLKDALAQGGVTSAEQNQMLNLASEIESLRAQHAAALNRGKKEKADELLQQIFAKEKQKDDLDQKLTKAYPKYGEIRFPKAPSVESIQKSLKGDEIFVSYLINTEKPVAFVVDNKQGLRMLTLTPQSLLPKGEGKQNTRSIPAWAQTVANFHALHTGNTEANVLPIPTKDGVIYWNSGGQKGKYDIDKEFNVMAIVHRRDRGMQSELANKAQFEKIAIGKAGDPLTQDQIKNEREKLRAELYNAFVAPIQKEYPAAKSWVVAPDGALYYMPFHLLSSDKLKMPDISLVHSAVVWQKLRGGERKATSKSLLAFGNAVYSNGHSDIRGAKAGKRRSAESQSEQRIGKMRIYGSTDTSELEWDNLNGTGEEVKGIAALAYSDSKEKAANVYTGVAANVDRVLALKEKKQLSDYKYIHFAVHGLFVDGNPALNALVMTQPEKAKQFKAGEYTTYTKNNPLNADGYLRAGDISALNLNADLVVMSACETSLGHEVGGEGMVALPQSFLSAGARSVVASLWSVDDTATSLFMQRFYRHLLRDKKKPKQALAATQRDFREGQEFARFRDPFYWAAFVMYGE